MKFNTRYHAHKLMRDYSNNASENGMKHFKVINHNNANAALNSRAAIDFIVK